MWNSCVAGHLAVIDGHVEILAYEHAFAREIQVGHAKEEHGRVDARGSTGDALRVMRDKSLVTSH